MADVKQASNILFCNMVIRMNVILGDSNRPIGVVGAGTLGTQISAHLLLSGHPVVLKTRSSDMITHIRDKVERIIEKYPDSKGAPYELRVVTDFCELKCCSLIIEAVSEDLSIKKDVLNNVERCVDDSTYIFTNSSSISIDQLASDLERPEMFLGYHLFNPVGRMGLVEIIIGERTGKVTIDAALELATVMKKEPVIVRNSPGFIVNRLLLWQINEAARMVEEKVSTVTDIDKAARLGLNHPLGPFQLADLIGLDVCLSILNTLNHDLGLPGYEPSPIIQSMVKEGRLGKKVGRGFYTYEKGGH